MAAFQCFLAQRDTLIQYLSQFEFFKTINAIDSIENMAKAVIALLRPQVLATLTYNNEELAEDFMKAMEKDLRFVRLDVETLCEDEVQRATPLGNQMSAFVQSGQLVPARMQCELLRKVFYQSPANNKFVLEKFPEKKLEFDAFEETLFPLEGFLNFFKPN